MFKHFIRKFSVIVICFSHSSMAYSDESMHEKPVYQGIVHVIDEPLSIQFSPFPKSVITNKSVSKVIVNGSTFEIISNSTGFSQIVRKGDNLELLMSVDEIETSKAGQKQTQKCDINLVLSLSPYGKFLNFQMESKSIPTSELAAAKGTLQNLFEQAISSLPEEGVSQGHYFVDKINMSFGDIHSIGRVLGQTTFRKRPSLLVDFSGSTMKLDLDGTTVETTVEGYALMDVATGVWSYNEVSMFVPIPETAGDSIMVHQQIEIKIQ